MIQNYLVRRRYIMASVIGVAPINILLTRDIIKAYSLEKLFGPIVSPTTHINPDQTSLIPTSNNMHNTTFKNN